MARSYYPKVRSFRQSFTRARNGVSKFVLNKEKKKSKMLIVVMALAVGAFFYFKSKGNISITK